jgi:hypothetical protein
MSEFVGIPLMKRIVDKRFAILFVGRERQEIDQAVGDVVGPGVVGRQPIANDLAARVADRLELVLDIIAEVLRAFAAAAINFPLPGKRDNPRCRSGRVAPGSRSPRSNDPPI